MFKDVTIGILGAGNIGEILIRGLLKAELVKTNQIIASDASQDRRAYVSNSYGVETLASNREIVERANLVILSVKPQNIDRVLDEIKDYSKPSQLFCSIIAGVPTSYISVSLHNQAAVVRVMPNTPALVLEGMSVICSGKNATEKDVARIKTIFNAVGKSVVAYDEELMDIVTGLSGSGPAFVFMFIEALSDAGVKLGLPRKTSNLLASQTVLGAAKMFLETGRHPSELKDLVATPGGTTFAGLRELERGNFRSTVMDAVEAATKRSRELGEKHR